MGGYGSGRRRNKKETTESQKQIDIRWLRKIGYLQPDTSGSLSWSRGGEQSGFINYRMEKNGMVLFYHFWFDGGEWEAVEQFVRFDWTPCNFGGFRTWLICPRCWKRVAVLYGAGKHFLCRHCYNLTYASQQENLFGRLVIKAQSIRERLGGSHNLFKFFPCKPKGMHWKTYNRLHTKSKIIEYRLLRILEPPRVWVGKCRENLDRE